MAGFFQLVEAMAGQDFFTGLLPFIVSYSVFYMAMRQVPLFQDDNNNVSAKGNQFAAIISLAGAFMVARFMYLNPFYQNYFVTYFGQVVVGIVGLLGLMTVLGFVGYSFDSDGYFANNYTLMFLAVAIAGSAFFVSGGFGPPRSLPFDSLAEVTAMLLSSPLTYIIPAIAVLVFITFGTGNTGAGVDGDGGVD